MALSDIGIERTRAEVNILDLEKTKLNDSLTQLESILKNDLNFQKFSEGTARGEAINNNLLRIVEIAKNTVRDTDELVSSTTAFLDKHDIENKKGLN